MTVRSLHLLGSPVLRQKAAPVARVDDVVRQLVDDLFETMRAAKGVGLAANQIGVARRVAVVDIGEEDPPPFVLINPVILERSDEIETAEEGCLSIPDIFGDVDRHAAWSSKRWIATASWFAPRRKATRRALSSTRSITSTAFCSSITSAR